MRTTVGSILINNMLPEDLRDYDRVWDKKSTSQVLDQLARRYPEKYSDISDELHKMGFLGSYLTSHSVGLDDLANATADEKTRTDTYKFLSDLKYTDMKKEDRENAIAEYLNNISVKKQKHTLETLAAQNNPLAQEVLAGARGNAAQLNSMVGSPVLILDEKDRPAPVPIFNSFSQGLSPAEYFAKTYGTRKGAVSTKFATADAGFLCLAGDTQVRMADLSIKEIKDIAVGDKVLGADKSGNVFPAEVSAIFNNGEREVYRYTARKGRSRNDFVYLDCTKNHKVLARNKNGKQKENIVQAIGELAKSCSLIPATGITDKDGYNEPLALLLGYLLGDGGLTGNSVMLSSNQPDEIDYLNYIYKKSNLNIRKVNRRLDSVEYLVEELVKTPLERDSLGHVVAGYKTPLRKKLADYKFLGKKAHQKNLPDDILKWDKKSIAALIAGLMASDGCVTFTNHGVLPVIRLALTSKDLVIGVKKLLEVVFGVYSSSTGIIKATGKTGRIVNGSEVVSNFDVYTITIANRDSLERFINQIEIPGIKGQVLSLAIKNAPKAKRDDSYTFKLTDKQYLGSIPTFDIEVDHPDHLFVLANGMIVSNSKQIALSAHKIIASGDKPTPGIGLPVDADDTDNIGSVLAMGVGKYKAGTIITPEVMANFPEDTKKILIHSAISDYATDGGVPSISFGLRERDEFPLEGEQVGIPAIQTITERLSQGVLNVKHCLSFNSQVLMANWAVKEIKDIKPGEYVMGADRDKNIFPVKVINVFDNGPREVYRTTFKQKKSQGVHKEQLITLDSTLDHEVLATRYVTAQNEEDLNGVFRKIKIGQKSRQFYAALPNGLINEEGLREEPFAFLIGLLLGDGCYTKSVNGVYFSCADLQLIEDAKEYLESLNLKFTKLAGHDYYYRVSQNNQISGDRSSLGQFKEGYRNPATKILAEYEMLYKKAHEKTIPDEVFSWDNKSVAALLAGLIITDGSVYKSTKKGKPGISFCSTSSALVEQIKYLFGMRFGLWFSNVTKVSCIGTRDGWRHNHEQWQITLTSLPDIKRFNQVIPLLGVKKNYLKELVDSIEESNNVPNGLTRIKQEPLGVLPTFDLEVDHPDHLFVLANGLIVSNSGGAGGKRSGFGGFKVIDQLLQVPKVFPSGAAHASTDGEIQKIEEAPGGGKNIFINDTPHYVADDQDPKVKVGEIVEAGDVLSDGLPNPAFIVEHKGIGEGRKYFMELMRDVLGNSAVNTNRKNIEVLSRAIINHVEVTEENSSIPGALPGDTIEYDYLASNWKPRKGSVTVPTKNVKSGYLEKPVLHYSIGTRITPRVRQTLKDFKVPEVTINDDPPPFQPVQKRAMTQLLYTPDWMERLGSFYIGKGLLDSVHRGGTADMSSKSYIPRLVTGQPVDVLEGPKGLLD